MDLMFKQCPRLFRCWVSALPFSTKIVPWQDESNWSALPTFPIANIGFWCFLTDLLTNLKTQIDNLQEMMSKSVAVLAHGVGPLTRPPCCGLGSAAAVLYRMSLSSQALCFFFGGAIANRRLVVSLQQSVFAHGRMSVSSCWSSLISWRRFHHVRGEYFIADWIQMVSQINTKTCNLQRTKKRLLKLLSEICCGHRWITVRNWQPCQEGFAENHNAQVDKVRLVSSAEAWTAWAQRHE